MPTNVPVQPTVANTHISDNFAKLLEPGLRKIFFETYNEVPEQYSKIFKINTSKKAKETDYGLGAFGDWEKRTSELDTVAYAKISAGKERTYIHEAFTKGFMISRELYEDEQYRQINKFAKALGRAGRAFVEKSAAKTVIKGFTENIYDGKPLFSDKHPLIDAGSKTCSNIVKGELKPDSLQAAILTARRTVDEAGNLILVKPNKLVVPPALEFRARTILNSTLLPGTSDNDANVLKNYLDLVVYDYMGKEAGGSDTAWFIMDDNISELNFFWRVKPEFKSADEFDSFVAKYRGYMRFSHGVSDWRGVVGSTGLAG